MPAGDGDRAGWGLTVTAAVVGVTVGLGESSDPSQPTDVKKTAAAVDNRSREVAGLRFLNAFTTGLVKFQLQGTPESWYKSHTCPVDGHVFVDHPALPSPRRE